MVSHTLHIHIVSSLVPRPFFILTFGGPGTRSLIKFSPEGRGQDNAILYHDKPSLRPRIHTMLVQAKREDLA